MKLRHLLNQESSKIPFFFPVLFFGIYAVLDWNVASAGGNSLMGLLVPVPQAIFLLYVAGMLAMGAAGAYLLVNRQWLKFCAYLIFVGYFAYQVTRDHDALLAVSRERSQYALQSMLHAPENFDVRFSDPTIKRNFFDQAKEGKIAATYIRATPFLHTYVYKSKVRDVEVELKVFMLRHETRFRVDRVGDSPGD